MYYSNQPNVLGNEPCTQIRNVTTPTYLAELALTFQSILTIV